MSDNNVKTNSVSRAPSAKLITGLIGVLGFVVVVRCVNYAYVNQVADLRLSQWIMSLFASFDGYSNNLAGIWAGKISSLAPNSTLIQALSFLIQLISPLIDCMRIIVRVLTWWFTF